MANSEYIGAFVTFLIAAGIAGAMIVLALLHVLLAGEVIVGMSTSGLSWKLPGRVGDSPIIGAGNYCDNAIGAAGGGKKG